MLCGKLVSAICSLENFMAIFQCRHQIAFSQPDQQAILIESDHYLFHVGMRAGDLCNLDASPSANGFQPVVHIPSVPIHPGLLHLAIDGERLVHVEHRQLTANTRVCVAMVTDMWVPRAIKNAARSSPVTQSMNVLIGLEASVPWARKSFLL